MILLFEIGEVNCVGVIVLDWMLMGLFVWMVLVVVWELWLLESFMVFDR